MSLPSIRFMLRPTVRSLRAASIPANMLKFNAASFHASCRTKAPEDAGIQDPFARNKQLGRPMSPHLSIYNWQLTNAMSILTRVTGVGAGVMFYAALLGYALAPASFGAASVVSWFAGHTGLLALTKAAIAVPVWYHTFGGIRHLIWDSGKALSLSGVYSTGYIAIAATVLFSVASFFY